VRRMSPMYRASREDRRWKIRRTGAGMRGLGVESVTLLVLGVAAQRSAPHHPAFPE
jgi:hypothetical protein